MVRLLASTLILALILAAGCSFRAPKFGLPRVHKITVQQGNVITQDMIDQLKPGMTRSQVRFLLGTPVVEDPFHHDRWDYIYYFRKGRGKRADRRWLIVYFQNDTVMEIRRDVEVEPS